MVTRAQRYMQLYAAVYVLDRIAGLAEAELVPIMGGNTRRTSRSTLLTPRKEMGSEMAELRRQMGFTEKRELEELMRAWKGERGEPPRP